MRVDGLLPGWRSAFILHRFDGRVTEHDDCIVVRTPSHPTNYWGNFRLPPAAPRDDQLAFWQARFAQEIGQHQPRTLHRAFGVNQPPAGESLPSWVADGFDISEEAVLQLQPQQLQAPPRSARGELVFRPLNLASECDAVVALQCADDHPFDPAGFAEHRGRQIPAGFAEHRGRQMARYAAMARQGRAAWFGVWCDGVLAADCGLMREHPGAGAGRFQHVSTHPGWRRRGLCSALVHGVCDWGFRHWGLPSLLMCADPADVAIGIYESLGFRRIAREWSLQRYAPLDEVARRARAAAE